MPILLTPVAVDCVVGLVVSEEEKTFRPAPSFLVIGYNRFFNALKGILRLYAEDIVTAFDSNAAYSFRVGRRDCALLPSRLSEVLKAAREGVFASTIVLVLQPLAFYLKGVSLGRGWVLISGCIQVWH